MHVAVVHGPDRLEALPVEVFGPEDVCADDGVQDAAGEAGSVADNEREDRGSGVDGDAAFEYFGGEEPAGDGGEAAGYGGDDDGGAVLAAPEDGAVLDGEV